MPTPIYSHKSEPSSLLILPHPDLDLLRRSSRLSLLSPFSPWLQPLARELCLSLPSHTVRPSQIPRRVACQIQIALIKQHIDLIGK